MRFDPTRYATVYCGMLVRTITRTTTATMRTHGCRGGVCALGS
jgi:hypothetical protein